MKPTQKLHDIGQSLWVDNITRDMLREGTLKGYIDDLSVTGLTSNPTIFDKAIGAGESYDQQVAELGDSVDDGGAGANAEENVFFELALADLREAADLFGDVHVRTGGIDGFVSLEVSPLLADDPGARRSRSRSSPGSRSTSRCCSTTSSTSAPPRPT
jgi:transaldolase